MNNNLKSFFKFPSTLLLVLISSFACAQASLEFESKEINLGYMPEDTGNVVVDFFFKNKQKTPVLITNVDTQGGCTLLSWPQDSLLAGYKGKLSVKLNPKNRPGVLERKITLWSMPDSTPYTLVIKGYVEPSEKVWDKNSNETRYGNIVLSSDYIRVGTVLETAKVERTIKVKNTGKELVKIPLAKAKLPAYISISGLPEQLGAKAEVTIKVIVDFAASQKLGKYVEMLTIPTSVVGADIVFYIIGEIVPAPVVNANKPVVEMLQRAIDLNEISSEKPIQGSFVLKNAGLSPLIIRKIETSCLCIGMEHNTPIAPGASATLYFMFDPRGLNGFEEKKITLYTNVPGEPIIHLLVKAKVSP